MAYERLTPKELARRSAAGLADRRARGEIMTYEQDGWMIREYPGCHIFRLCPVDQFVAALYPIEAYPIEAEVQLEPEIR